MPSAALTAHGLLINRLINRIQLAFQFKLFGFTFIIQPGDIHLGQYRHAQRQALGIVDLFFRLSRLVIGPALNRLSRFQLTRNPAYPRHCQEFIAVITFPNAQLNTRQ
jgi:hypothetical protein